LRGKGIKNVGEMQAFIYQEKHGNQFVSFKK